MGTFLIVTTGGRYWHPVSRGRGRCRRLSTGQRPAAKAPLARMAGGPGETPCSEEQGDDTLMPGAVQVSFQFGALKSPQVRLRFYKRILQQLASIWYFHSELVCIGRVTFPLLVSQIQNEIVGANIFWHFKMEVNFLEDWYNDSVWNIWRRKKNLQRHQNPSGYMTFTKCNMMSFI